MKAESNSPLTLLARALERWENEGGRVAQANPQQSPTRSPFIVSPCGRKDFEAESLPELKALGPRETPSK